VSSSTGSGSPRARRHDGPPDDLDLTEGNVAGAPPLADFLRAVGAISSDLDTAALLDQLVLSACDLIGTRYGALLVFNADGSLERFVTHGVDREHGRLIGDPPTGCGLLAIGAHQGGSLRLEDVSQHPRFTGFPPHHPLLQTLLFAPVRVRGTEYGSLYLSEKADGAPFTREDQEQLEALAQMAGFVVENAQAYAISERRRRWLEMFGDLSDGLQPPVSLATALSRVVSAVRLASGAAASSIVQVPDQGPVEITAQSGDARLFEALSNHVEEAVRSVVTTGEVQDLVLESGVSALMAPLRAHLAMPGVLLIAHDRSSRPDYVEERDLLASFADHVALSLDRTQALQEREEMAVVADRDRIARELHDVVIQRLFATGLHLQSVRTAAESPELKERIGEVVKDVDQTIRDIRGTIFSLQSRPQDSLRAEVREVVREYVPQLGFAPSVQLQGRVDQGLGPQIQPVFMAVLREALGNVARHARAGSVWIDLRVSDDQVQLRVTDNGRGIPEQRHESGLRHARRRAMLLGGSLDLWANEPSGTIFVWSVPLPRSS
jgi:signal transduction histidine kinase